VGAAVVHIHVRDPSTGKPSMELAYCKDGVERIRADNKTLVLNITTGPGGRFAPSEDDPKVAGPGTNLMLPEKRVEHIAALRRSEVRACVCADCECGRATESFAACAQAPTPRAHTLLPKSANRTNAARKTSITVKSSTLPYP
jgi:uncharacterized protein (DUF849 family)